MDCTEKFELIWTVLLFLWVIASQFLTAWRRAQKFRQHREQQQARAQEHANAPQPPQEERKEARYEDDDEAFDEEERFPDEEAFFPDEEEAFAARQAAEETAAAKQKEISEQDLQQRLAWLTAPLGAELELLAELEALAEQREAQREATDIAEEEDDEDEDDVDLDEAPEEHVVTAPMHLLVPPTPKPQDLPTSHAGLSPTDVRDAVVLHALSHPRRPFP